MRHHHFLSVKEHGFHVHCPNSLEDGSLELRFISLLLFCSSDYDFEAGVIFVGISTAALYCFNIFMNVLGIFSGSDQF